MPRPTVNNRLGTEAFELWFSKALKPVLKSKSILIPPIYFKCLFKAKHMLKSNFAWHSA